MSNIIFFKPARQVENTGDLLINKVLIDLLIGYGKVIVDNTSSPQWFINELKETDGVELLTEKTEMSIFSYIKEALNKNSGRNNIFLFYPPGHVSKSGMRNAASSTIDLVKLTLLNRLGCKIITVGFTSGPFDGLNTILEKFRSYNHHYYGVRDFNSLRLTQESNFKNNHYFPDLAWAFAPTATYKDLIIPSEKDNVILISFRSNKFGSVHNHEYLKPIVAQLKEILTSKQLIGFKIKCIYQVEYDRESALDIQKELGKYCEVDVIDKKLSLRDAVALYSKSKYVISNRLHVLLLAAQCGTIPFPLIYLNDNRKITSIFSDNQLDNFMLEINDAASINIDKVSQVIKDQDNAVEKFNNTRAKNVNKIQENLNSIFLA